MCPLWPFHYVLLYLLMICPLWLLSFKLIGVTAAAAPRQVKPKQVINYWKSVQFNPSEIVIKVDEVQSVQVIFNKTEFLPLHLHLHGDQVLTLEFMIEDEQIAKHESPKCLTLDLEDLEDESYYPRFNLSGHFLGYTSIQVKAQKQNETTPDTDEEWVSDQLRISVIRESGALDLAFTYSLVTLVAIIYINMGAALDMKTVLGTLKKPIGPAIGFCTQFLLMPVLSYGVAKLLIQEPALQLGLFITGCSPGGGASNVWTLALGGNLDLSVTMTTISTFSAFAMMPLWILTLGSTIAADANLVIPYSKIISFAGTLVIPLAIGILIQRTAPNVAKFLIKMLKPFALFLIIFIIVFAIYTNLCLFQLFTWQILISGLLLPCLGYLLAGGTAALLFKQTQPDVIAIAIETGVQNTGLAIFALRFSLPQPEADLTTALPVAVAIMTPILPTLFLLVQKLSNSNCCMTTTRGRSKSRTSGSGVSLGLGVGVSSSSSSSDDSVESRL